jgi:hypothetical protein
VWNLTNPDPAERTPSTTTRAILRGLLQAALIALDEQEFPLRAVTMQQDAR